MWEIHFKKSSEKSKVSNIFLHHFGLQFIWAAIQENANPSPEGQKGEGGAHW